LTGERLELSWKDYKSGAKAVIWATPTNQFKYGEMDIYRHIGEIDLGNGEATFDLKHAYKNLKVVLELPEGYLNVWVTNTE
jgi:hypothetical protein